MKERKQKPAEHTEGKAVAASPASAVDTAVNEKGEGKAHSHGSFNDPLQGALKSLETTSPHLQSEVGEASEAKPATAPAPIQGAPASVSIDSGTRAEIERQLADHLAERPLQPPQVKELERGTQEIAIDVPVALNDEEQNCVKTYPGSAELEPRQEPQEGRTLGLPGEYRDRHETSTFPGRIEEPNSALEAVKVLPERESFPLKLEQPTELSPVEKSSLAPDPPREVEAAVPGPERAIGTAKLPFVKDTVDHKTVSPDGCLAEPQHFFLLANVEKLTETISFQRLFSGVPLVLTGSPRSTAQVAYLLVPLPPAPLAERSGPSTVESPASAPPQTKGRSQHFCFLPLLPLPDRQAVAENRQGELVPERGGEFFTARPLMPVTGPQTAERVPLPESEKGEKLVSPAQPGVHPGAEPGLSASLSLQPGVTAAGPELPVKSRDRYYISGPDLVFAAIIALASTASRRHDDLTEAVESGSPSASVLVNVLCERSRPSLIVSHGDSLEAIAEQYFNDRRLGHLLADINERVICQCQLDGKRIVRIKVGQVLQLPLLEDITDFHSRRTNKEKCRQRLLTIVEDTEVSKEVLMETFKPFLKRLS
ncbi:MAG: hypothetical protein IPK73_12980 [Candidatus Obscuribacter sp.]|nr:hypothetical protein [Candidatus Obscuribacter sp.]MBK9281942.1 hypothetical protein [Candidatus Obscuribacter sp.]